MTSCRTRVLPFSLVSFVVLLAVALASIPAYAAVLTVTNTNDSGAGSLRDQVAAAASGDTIDFTAGLSGQTITLTSGEIILDKNLTIDGSSLAQRVTVSGNNNSRIFYIGSAVTISVSSLRIVNGSTTTGDPGDWVGDGGAIHVRGGGSINIENSEFVGNQAEFNGGAIYLFADAGTTLTNSTFTSNSSALAGGAVRSSGTLPVRLEGNTFSNNASNEGGAFWTFGGGEVVTNNTFADNTGDGTLYHWDTLELTNNTFLGNDGVTVRSLNAVLNMRNNIIGSCRPTDGGSIGVNVNNWIVNGDCSPANSGDPFLMPLSDNGGPTRTAALMPLSGAVNAATSDCPATDQRGEARGASCDLGAYEVSPTDYSNQCHSGLVQGETYGFGATGIIVTVDTLGSLSQLCATLEQSNHPNATSGLQTGRHWQVTPTAGGNDWSVTMSAPATFSLDSDDRLCRYTGTGQVWECGTDPATSFVTNRITRSNIQQLSAWAVGTASFPVTAATGTGSGSITPASQLVDSGSNASFTVTPQAGWSVDSVSGDTCTPTNTTGSTWVASNITSACSVTADFAQNTFSVSSTAAAGQGTITPPSQNVVFDGTASFTVTPDTGWSVDAVTGNTCTPAQVSGTSWQAPNIQADCNVEASFVINSYTVAAAVGSGDGSITPPSQDVDHGADATFTVTPDTGWSVTAVSGDTCTPTNTTGSTWVASNITSACSVTANFAQDNFNVSASVAAGQGGITPPSQSVVFDGTASFTVTPDPGWSVDTVTGNTCAPAQVTGTSWEAPNIQADCAVEASFVINTYTVAAAVGTGDGSITPPSQDVDHGSDATFTVTPDTGWSVTSVNGDTCTPTNTTGSTWVASNITSACSVTADFAQDTFDVTTTVTAGQGDITPPSQNVAFDGTVSFTVTPDTGWSVDAVGGDTCAPSLVAGDNWQAPNIRADCTVEASFVINTYTVTTAVGTGDGSITPPSQDVDHGSDATFTVTPDTGWSVTSVSGDTCSPVLDSGDQWIAANITEACAVSADFAEDTFTVAASVSAGQGTITPASQNVAFDGSASFTVTPDIGWSVDAVGGNTCTPALVSGDNWQAPNIQADCNVEASFVINSYTVSAAVGTGDGSITPPSQSVDHGGEATFTVTADTGWSVTSVSGDTCTPTNTTGTTWVASNITSACSVTADFAQDTFNVSSTVAGGQGDITPANQDVVFDETANFTVTPDTGWSVDAVGGNTCTPALVSGEIWQAPNVQADCAVEASFVINSYTVAAAVGTGDGSITPPSQDVDHGSDATFTVMPDPSWAVTAVSGDTCSPVLDSGDQWVAANITEACTVTADFAQDTFTVEASVAAGQGEITPISQNVIIDDTASLTVTPDTGWSVDAVGGDTCAPSLVAGDNWEAVNIQADCAVEASFVINSYNVTAAVGTGEGSITPLSQAVDHGSDAAFTITPDSNRSVDSVTGDTCSPVLDSGDQWVAADITEACAVTANFSQDSVIELGLSLNDIQFSNLEPGENSQQSLTLTNLGQGDLIIEEFVAPSLPFGFDPQDCAPLPRMLAAGEACTVMVSFEAATTGDFDDELLIVSNGENSPSAVGLSGGTVRPAVPVPALGLPALLLLLAGVALITLRRKQFGDL